MESAMDLSFIEITLFLDKLNRNIIIYNIQIYI